MSSIWSADKNLSLNSASSDSISRSISASIASATSSAASVSFAFTSGFEVSRVSSIWLSSSASSVFASRRSLSKSAIFLLAASISSGVTAFASSCFANRLSCSRLPLRRESRCLSSVIRCSFCARVPSTLASPSLAMPASSVIGSTAAPSAICVPSSRVTVPPATSVVKPSPSTVLPISAFTSAEALGSLLSGRSLCPALSLGKSSGFITEDSINSPSLTDFSM